MPRRTGTDTDLERQSLRDVARADTDDDSKACSTQQRQETDVGEHTDAVRAEGFAVVHRGSSRSGQLLPTRLESDGRVRNEGWKQLRDHTRARAHAVVSLCAAESACGALLVLAVCLRRRRRAATGSARR
eukprot:6189257-Pleurochrysis_carterae.AAC.4